MRVGIADHLGWAVAVTASADHEVVDRRRIELIEPGMTAAPIHYESRRLDVAATAALVAKARASVARATSAASTRSRPPCPSRSSRSRSEPGRSISPTTSPSNVARRSEARADAIMYRQELSELAHARGWEVHLYRREGSAGLKRSPCWPSGPTRSCRDLGQRWGHPGRRTIGWRSPRRSRPAPAARRSGAAGSGFERRSGHRITDPPLITGGVVPRVARGDYGTSNANIEYASGW